MKVYIKDEQVGSSNRCEIEDWVFITNRHEEDLGEAKFAVSIYNFIGSEKEYEELRLITPIMQKTLENMGYVFDVDKEECRPPLSFISMSSTELLTDAKTNTLDEETSSEEKVLATKNPQHTDSNFEYLQKAINIITQRELHNADCYIGWECLDDAPTDYTRLARALLMGQWKDKEGGFLARMDGRDPELEIDGGVLALYQLLGESLIIQLEALARLIPSQYPSSK